MPHGARERDRPRRIKMCRIPSWLTLWLTRVTVAAIVWLGAHPIPRLSAQTQVSAAVSAHEAYAGLPGVRIFYEDTGGSGVPVVFLHAATGSSRVWEYQIPAFTAAGYRYIAFDRRGWGRTAIGPAPPPPGTGAHDPQNLIGHPGIDPLPFVGTRRR